MNKYTNGYDSYKKVIGKYYANKKILLIINKISITFYTMNETVEI